MRALVVVNDYELDRSEIERLSPDFFYCLFDVKSLYEEDLDSHFYIGQDSLDWRSRILKNFKSKLIDEVVVHCDQRSFDYLSPIFDLSHIKLKRLSIGHLSR